MAKYDDASWHYEGDYPADLPPENAATHIGMFVAWCIHHDMMSEELLEDAEDEMLAVKAREMTGGAFLRQVCDEKFCDSDLSDGGKQFADAYYEEKGRFSKKYQSYSSDFCDVFDEKAERQGFVYASSYHVEDTWENYDLMAAKIDARYAEWQAGS